MTDVLDDLTDRQREAVTHGDGPLLVVAGAGSGKTRVITRRVAHLAAGGVPPYRIAAITFTNKAADEMKRRVELLTGARGANVSTFHSLCARMLRQFQDRLGFEHPFSIYDRSDSLACVKAALKELGLADTKLKPRSFLSAISRAKNDMLDPDALAAQAANDRQARTARVYAAYQRLCRTNNALDFDDLLICTAQLLEADADFRGYWQARWNYLLVDEYQDTNRPQYLIARQLSAAHRNLCVTGDPDQSIYAWRGADIRNILDFQKDYPDAKTVKLEENFRSTKKILSAASGVIENNRARIERGLWTRNDVGESVDVVESDSDLDEAEAILAGIRERAAAGHAYGDMAVFYRTHAQSRVVEDALRDAGVPYAILDAVEFYNRKEIKDVVAYLKLIVNPSDAVSMLRIINEPRRGIGARTIEQVRAWTVANGVPFTRAVASAVGVGGLSARAAAALAAFDAMMAKLRGLPRAPVADLVGAVLNETGYLAALKKSQAPEDAARAENVEELINAAAEFGLEYPDAGLEVFLERVTLVSDSDAMTSDEGRVLLMTLHSAKGLEFPVVFIAGVQEGLLPHLNSLGSRQQVEEERRLCYVGITRAKQRLSLHWAARHFRAGQMAMGVPSRFIEEIPEDARRQAFGGAAEVPAASTPSRPRTVSLGGGRVLEYDDDVVEYGDGALQPGDLVRHPTYGTGRVVSLSGSGSQARVAVNFRGKMRRFMLQYVELVRLN